MAKKKVKKKVVRKHLKRNVKKNSGNSKGLKKLSNEKKEKIKEKIKKHLKRNCIENYNVDSNGAVVDVCITQENFEMMYEIDLPSLDKPTVILLENIRKELVSMSIVSMQELTNEQAFASIKERFLEQASAIIKNRLPNSEEKKRKYLVGRLIQDMLGLSKIEFLISDPHLEEIVIPSAQEPVRVYSKKYGWLTTNLTVGNEEEIVNYSNIIGRRVGRQITILSPLLDAHLTSGDRVNAVLYPINTKGNTITIRKFARDPYTVVDLINSKTLDSETAALLWLAVEYEMNVLVSGGTGSGKTSMLNALMPFIPPNQRIISIEDTRELTLPKFLYWTPLVTRAPNPEGKGEVTMLHLLVNSLRMRPDRIILGEMRKQEEATVLFEAMHTGHSVYATVHAETAHETVSRLVNPPLSVPANLLKSVNINVVMFRDRKRGIRRVFQLAEFDAAKDIAKANVLYRWIPERDVIVKHSENSRLFEDLARNTGRTEKTIREDLVKKQNILNWLVKEKIRDLQEIGKVMNLYYKNQSVLLEKIKKNDKSYILGN